MCHDGVDAEESTAAESWPVGMVALPCLPDDLGQDMWVEALNLDQGADDDSTCSPMAMADGQYS